MPPGRSRWSSFVADAPGGARPVRGLHEPGNGRHRLRVEFDRETLLVHLSDEDAGGWTCLAVDRASRATAVAWRRTQHGAATAACRVLRGEEPADRPDAPPAAPPGAHPRGATGG